MNFHDENYKKFERWKQENPVRDGVVTFFELIWYSIFICAALYLITPQHRPHYPYEEMERAEVAKDQK